MRRAAPRGTNRSLVGAEKYLGAGWCPAFACNWGFSNQQTIGVSGAYEETCRCQHRNMTGKILDSIKIVLANCGTSGTAEANTGNPIQARVTVQRMGTTVTDESGYRYDITKTDSITMTVEDRGTIEADALPFRVDVDEVLFFYVTPTATIGAQLVPIGGCIFGDVQDFGLNNGEGRNSGGNFTRNGSGNIAGNNGGGSRVYRIACILGHCADNIAVNSCAQISDSKGAGANDMAIGRNDYGGYFARLCRFHLSTGGTPFSNLACTGHSATSNAAADGMATRLKILKYFTHCVVALEYNDRGGTLATLKTSLLTITTTLRDLGVKVMVCTSFPGNVATTDGYQTVANQTPDANTNRTGLNTHLDDLTATGFIALSDKAFTDRGRVAANYGWCKVLDLAAGVECNVSGVLTRNGGYVIAPTTNTPFTTTSGGTSSTAIISALGATWMQYAGWLFYWSGGGANNFDIIRDNGSGAIAPVNTIQLENGLSNSITTAQTVQVYNGMLQRDKIHPTSPMHSAVAAGCQTTFNGYMSQ